MERKFFEDVLEKLTIYRNDIVIKVESKSDLDGDFKLIPIKDRLDVIIEQLENILKEM